MQRIKFIYKLFLSEPLWFKTLIIAMLLISVIFSNSSFNDYYRSCAKLAAAVFFCAYGIKFRRNTQIFVLFLALAVICIYLSWRTIS